MIIGHKIFMKVNVMKNAINFYYNIIPTNIHQTANLYHFYDERNNYYAIIPYDGNLKQVTKIYNMHLQLLNKGVYVHQIILNKENNILTIINGSPYILLKVYNYKGEIKVEDIMNFSYKTVTKKEYFINWGELWARKNDYLEYQLSQLGNKYPYLRESLSYFIGLGETSIQIFNLLNLENIPIVVSHKRLKYKDTLFDFYNPLNLLYDFRVRDISEYLKSYFFTGENILPLINLYILNANLSYEECLIFLARLLYPTYYFDLFESIINGETSEVEIKKITKKVIEFEKFIKDFYHYIRSVFNIPIIEWLER